MSFGLALSGGSLRGAAHIGLLGVLHENGLIPNLIAGTSAGSIVGSLYASGMLPTQIEKSLLQLYAEIPNKTEETILPMLAEPYKIESLGWIPLPKGLLKANFIEKFILNWIGPITFEELPLPLAITATDLQTGELVIFTHKKAIPKKPWPKRVVYVSGILVAEAVRASSAIPGIFTPKEIKGRLLADGGLIDNVPVDVLSFLGAKKIIAVDLEFGVEKSKPPKNIIEILLQSHDIMGQRVSDLLTHSYANLVIRPKVGGASLFDFTKIPGFIQKGREAGLENLTAIKELVMN